MNARDESLEELLAYLRDVRAFDYGGYRRATLSRRIEKRAQSVGATGWKEYRAYLDAHPEEFGELFNTILINVTGFFRDSETWEVLGGEVIPRLLAEKGPIAPIRVWSAGCASGEEPYTVAMLFAEAMGDEEFQRRVKVYGTDVDEEALAEAREASFTAKQLENVPAELRERYFQPADRRLAVRSDLRRRVIFGRNDLHRDPPISRVDLLLSRNTLMYFDRDAQERVLANFYFALNRGGFLVVGKAEALQRGRAYFAPYDLKRRVFVKDGSAEPPPFRVALLPSLAEPSRHEPPELGEVAFEHTPTAQVVLDVDNRVAAINHAARELLGLSASDVGAPLQDLKVSYQPVELRSLIDEVRAGAPAASRGDVHLYRSGRPGLTLEVEVAPLAAAGDEFAGVIVSFVDTTVRRALEQNLERARRELETAYEELQSTVEELETTNEELQSTNEELETTNEELQSTNEELETMNEELQSTNEELETMNEELRERTDETLHANSFLATVLASIAQAVIVVDRSMCVIAWSRRATELWGLHEDEVESEHLLNLDIGLPVEQLRDPVRQVLAGGETPALELAGHDRRGKPVRATVVFAPLYRRPGNEEPDGVILLIEAERQD